MSTDAKRLLIIDDDTGLLNQYKWGLDDYEVLTANNRSSAISSFKEYLPPVVTLDLGLPPDIDGESVGFEILQQIMQIAPETRVIIISASENPTNTENAMLYGAYKYCTKPVEIHRLKEILDQAFQAYYFP